MIKKTILFFIIITMIGSAFCLTAGELKGVKMEDTLDIEGKKLVLNGMALRKKFIFKVYVAGLYLPEKEQDAKKDTGSRRATAYYHAFCTQRVKKEIERCVV